MDLSPWFNRFLWFSRPGGSGLLTISRCNDFELYRPTRSGGLALERLLRGRPLAQDDSSLLTSPGQACGKANASIPLKGENPNPKKTGPTMNASPSHDLIIGLDRSDQKADLHLIETSTGKRWDETLPTSPESLQAWLHQLREKHPQARVAICLEQPAVALIAFLEVHDWIVLYPINPITLQKFREAFVTSRAKDDRKDARYLAELLSAHHDKLTSWKPEDSRTRLLQHLVLHRRAVVDERTGLTNRLQALLKQYFPQALDLCGDDLWRPLATAFLLKWPSLQALQKARPETLKTFYHLHGSRSQKLMVQRLQCVENAVILTREPALVESYALRVKLVCRELQMVVLAIADYDKQIADVFKDHPDREIFSELPGAGRTLAPRLLAAMGTQRDQFADAASLQRFSGIAPVTKQSGGSRYVHRRYLCRKFLRQSFHEYAKESILHCRWAAAYYKQQREKGAHYHTAVRALAFKWQRVIWKCWHARTPYRNEIHEAALQRNGSLIVASFSQIELGKSPFKKPTNQPK